jgi:probable HAF family extracellular repeat protein
LRQRFQEQEDAEMRFPRCLVVLAIIFAGLRHAPAAVYSIVDLGTLGGDWSNATALNNHGEVVGVASTTDPNFAHAYVYSGGVMKDLGTLGGSRSQAFRINDSGQVVGDAETGDFATTHAFVYSGGVMKDLGTLGGRSSRAFGINDSGQVVGEADTTLGSRTSHAFLYGGGVMKDLGTLDGATYCAALAINNSGQIVGYSLGPGDYTPVLYSGGVMKKLDGVGGHGSASDINELGEIVGTMIVSPTRVGNYAFLYSGGVVTDLGNLGGYASGASAINNRGQIVGSFTPRTGYFDPNYSHAFLYENGLMTDLNSLLPANSGWTNLLSADDINDYGQIVGLGWIGGHKHAFLITPEPMTVPEPSSLLVWSGIVCAGTTVIRRRRRSQG